MDRARAREYAEQRRNIPIEGVNGLFLKDITLKELQAADEIEDKESNPEELTLWYLRNCVCWENGDCLLEKQDTMEVVSEYFSTRDLQMISQAISQVYYGKKN